MVEMFVFSKTINLNFKSVAKYNGKIVLSDLFPPIVNVNL